LILSTAEEDGIATKVILPQDPGQAGKAQIDDMVAMLAGFNARAEIQSGSKEVRAEPFSAQMERGNVAVLKRTWTRDLLDELRFFPRGKFKDQVDAASSAFNALAPLTRQKKRTLWLIVDGEKAENWLLKTSGAWSA
jgi:predicted phage terminase large subunit-like protein